MLGHLGQFSSLGRIGEGTYGVVLKCQHKSTGQLVAIKKFKDTEDDEQVRKTAMREVKLLQNVRHDNIVRLLDFFRAHRKLFLVFEYVEGTVLQELERCPHGLGDAATRRIMWQLVRATEHLHASQIVHRDIKPENMLLSSSGLLKLCDFGFARYLAAPAAPGDMSDYVATRWYRAPELLVGDRSYGPPVDVWAIGCMVVEMQTGQPLFPGESDIDQLWLILKSFTQAQIDELRGSPLFKHMRVPALHERVPLDKRLAHLPAETLEFVKACLQPRPEQRRPCWSLLGMPYFRDAASWFPRNFFPSTQAERAGPQQTMLAERQRAKARRPKRKADVRSSLVAPALDMSPPRAARLLQCSESRESLFGASAATPMQTESGCGPASPVPWEGGMPSPGAQVTCSIVPKEAKSKGGVVYLEARAGGPVDSTASTDECMSESPSVSHAASAMSGEATEAESVQLGRRRSQRLQNAPHAWPSPQRGRGPQPRLIGFSSPEPRTAKQRDRRQPTMNGKGTSSPIRQHGARSQRSPLKGAWRHDAWQPAGRGGGRGRGGPGLSRASVDLSMSGGDETDQQGIPAHYGPSRLPCASDGAPQAVHPWARAGWVNGTGLQTDSSHASQQSPHQTAAVLQRWQGQPAAGLHTPAEESSGHYRSPLRAHAPPFVPQAQQGWRAGMHAAGSAREK